ncbi:PREDICTED: uncharacterized protein LOC101292812 [Fragaria vesca subsp. vesca]
MSQHELETNGSSFLREMPPRDSGADLYHVNSQRNKEEMDSKLDPLIAFRTLLTGHHHKETLVSCSQHHHSGQLTLKELASSTEMVWLVHLSQQIPLFSERSLTLKLPNQLDSLCQQIYSMQNYMGEEPKCC